MHERAAQGDRARGVPWAGSEERLGRNLRGLDRALAERLRLPVESDHVVFDDAGVARLRVQRELVLLDAPLHGELPAGDVFVLGVGTGELVEKFLARPGNGRCIAWERDPWLLRLALMRCDWAKALKSGALVLRLGADIVTEARRGDRAALVEHPVLGALYQREARLYASGAPAPIGLLGDGGLFVEAFGRALEARGYGLLTVQPERTAEEELAHAVHTTHAAFLATVNYTEGTAEFAHAHSLPVLCWEIDPRTHAARPPHVSAQHVGLFTWRAKSVATWQRSGFAHTKHLPLAADPAERHPVELAELEHARYGASCALVGNSMVAEARTYRARIVALLEAWRGGAADNTALEVLLAEQRKDFSRWRIPELLDEHLPGFLEFARERSAVDDPLMLLGEVAAAEKRLTYAANLGRHGLRVYGDEGWRAVESHGVRYMGPAGHRHELNRIYCGATINIDVGRLYQQDIVTMRVFDVLACGGFVLAEHSEELEQLFDVGREVVSYRNLHELRALVEHFLARPAEAAAIAARGYAAVLERHRVDQRVDVMLADLPALAAAAR